MSARAARACAPPFVGLDQAARACERGITIMLWWQPCGQQGLDGQGRIVRVCRIPLCVRAIILPSGIGLLQRKEPLMSLFWVLRPQCSQP